MANNEDISSELNGRLIRVINVDGLNGYLSHRSADTGHIIFTRQNAGSKLEYHILIIQGKPMAAYSSSSSEIGAAIIKSLSDKPGVVEYYFLEERIIHFVMDKYPQIAISGVKKPEAPPVIPVEKKSDEKAGQGQEKAPAAAPATAQADRSVAVKPTASEVEAAEVKPKAAQDVVAPKPMPDAKPEPHVPTPAPIGKDENDADLVKNIETEFVSNVDDLLNRLKLTHLKTTQSAKK